MGGANSLINQGSLVPGPQTLSHALPHIRPCAYAGAAVSTRDGDVSGVSRGGFRASAHSSQSQSASCRACARNALAVMPHTPIPTPVLREQTPPVAARIDGGLVALCTWEETLWSSEKRPTPSSSTGEDLKEAALLLDTQFEGDRRCLRLSRMSRRLLGSWTSSLRERRDSFHNSRHSSLCADEDTRARLPVTGSKPQRPRYGLRVER